MTKHNGKGNGVYAGKRRKFAPSERTGNGARKVNPAFASYVQRIKAAWQKAVASILETGLILLEAKDKLSHGQFLKMIHDQLPFGPRTAQMLMRIAKHPVLSNTKYLSHLPPSWATLYALTMISDAVLVQYIERGQVNAGTTSAEVKRLGVHQFKELPQALRLLLSFMGKFPDPNEIAEELVEHGGLIWEAYHLYDLTKLPEWIERLLIAGKRYLDEVDAEERPGQPPEREKIYDHRGVRFKDDVQHTD